MSAIPSPIVFTLNNPWINGADSYSLVCACGCGIRSGASYATAEEAAREPMHGGYRGHIGRAVWNGELIPD